MSSTAAAPEERQPMEDDSSEKKSAGMDNRSMSIDTEEEFRPPRNDAPRRGARPPKSPHVRRAVPSPRYPPPIPRYPDMSAARPVAHRLQSVVTESFSAEERDAMHSIGRGRPMHYSFEQRIDHEERFAGEEQRDDWSSPRFVRNPQLPPQVYEGHTADMSPPPRARMSQPHTVQRVYSSPGYYHRHPESLKRNFYHHSQSRDDYGRDLPSDFLPPKRVKIASSAKGEKVVAPRGDHGKWYRHGGRGSFETDEGRYKYISRSNSYPVQPSWTGHFHPPHSSSSPLYARMPEFGDVQHQGEPEVSPRHWPSTPMQHWASPSFSHDWSPPREQMSFSEHDRMDQSNHELQRRGSFPLPPQPPPTKGAAPGKTSNLAIALPTDGSIQSSPGNTDQDGDSFRTLALPSGDSVLLLALKKDRVSLSETLCVVRENVEVFTATQNDVDAPAPGRKHAVVVGQVGLRCIHCRHTVKASDRVKRAVCYPSSIKRIYRTVIDMKLDHFSNCKFVPEALKARLDELKSVHTRSTGTTMQYFIRAAHSIGMEDGPTGTGVRLDSSKMLEMNSPFSRVESFPSPPAPVAVPPQISGQMAPQNQTSLRVERHPSSNVSQSSGGQDSGSSLRSDSMISADSFDTAGTRESASSLQSGKFFRGLVPLALPEDKQALSPLRCFLREQVCAFSATEDDIAVRAPTTFSIAVGQVGIGCIHCVKQPAKLRSNRAVCFPFSIGRIYQSVADIQRFHLGECKMLPAADKEKFAALQSASSKGSKGLATRQYWVTSAKRIGLVDTQHGIRFGRDPTQPGSPKAFSLDILAQVAFSVTTSNKQLVLPEDKPCIAEFLYVVMEQLQPCRFTEADRNKRRLKHVGCIGVECKHCAGQVDGRKFFWSSVSAVESNFVSVHTHMLECRMVPDELKQRLIKLKKLRKKQTAALKTGSQKAFFARVWQRLHTDEHKKAGGPEQNGSPQEPPQAAAGQQPPQNATPQQPPENAVPQHSAQQQAQNPTTPQALQQAPPQITSQQQEVHQQLALVQPPSQHVVQEQVVLPDGPDLSETQIVSV